MVERSLETASCERQRSCVFSTLLVLMEHGVDEVAVVATSARTRLRRGMYGSCVPGATSAVRDGTGPSV